MDGNQFNKNQPTVRLFLNGELHHTHTQRDALWGTERHSYPPWWKWTLSCRLYLLSGPYKNASAWHFHCNSVRANHFYTVNIQSVTDQCAKSSMGNAEVNVPGFNGNVGYVILFYASWNMRQKFSYALNSWTGTCMDKLQLWKLDVMFSSARDWRTSFGNFLNNLLFWAPVINQNHWPSINSH